MKLFFTNSQSNGADWSSIDKSWTQKLKTAQEQLVSGGWKISNSTGYAQRVITLSAEISLSDLISDFDRAQERLEAAIRKVQID